MKEIICIRCKQKTLRATINALYCLECAEEVNKANLRIKYRIEKFGFEKKCYFCGTERSLQIHHIDKNKNNKQKSNLLCLCLLCHKKLHNKIYKRLWQS